VKTEVAPVKLPAEEETLLMNQNEEDNVIDGKEEILFSNNVDADDESRLI